VKYPAIALRRVYERERARRACCRGLFRSHPDKSSRCLFSCLSRAQVHWIRDRDLDGSSNSAPYPEPIISFLNVGFRVSQKRDRKVVGSGSLT
jgi:hypothetical protein